ncbi:trehalose-phosphatase [Natronorarus salvus]|uniref:trehalose-phosphatase n=1 Tax=Natronorarus salvus TaxID=3117733 RepID=UPI002F26DD9E
MRGRFADEVTDAFARTLTGNDGLLFCTDFDGTLSPIETDPDAPTLPPENERALRRLRDRERVRVGVVSGRGLSDLRERVGIDGIAYAGNHGLELALDGERIVHPIAERREREIGRLCDAIEREVGERVLVERKGLTATVHYRKANEGASRAVRALVRREAGTKDGIRTVSGKQSVELRPAVEWDKGRAVSLLRERVPSTWTAAYLGDDTTDESVFRTLGTGLSVHVGEGETDAEHRLPDTDAVSELLDWLADGAGGRLVD